MPSKIAMAKTAYDLECDYRRRRYAIASFPLEVATAASDLLKLIEAESRDGVALTDEAEAVAQQLEAQICEHFARKFGKEL